jgi:hypothetical protein
MPSGHVGGPDELDICSLHSVVVIVVDVVESEEECIELLSCCYNSMLKGLTVAQLFRKLADCYGTKEPSLFSYYNI